MAELIVEDGTGVEDANTLVDMDFVDAYHEDRLNTAWEEGDDDAKVAAVIRANDYVVNKYAGRWTGSRFEEANYLFPWPRYNAVYADGRVIADNVIPIELKRAIAEAALRELASPNSLTPDQVSTQQIKRIRKKLGPLEKETEYVDSAGGVSTRPQIVAIEEILAPLLANPAASRVAFLMRA